jgi:hypothetical protein
MYPRKQKNKKVRVESRIDSETHAVLVERDVNISEFIRQKLLELASALRASDR